MIIGKIEEKLNNIRYGIVAIGPRTFFVKKKIAQECQELIDEINMIANLMGMYNNIRWKHMNGVYISFVEWKIENIKFHVYLNYSGSFYNCNLNDTKNTKRFNEELKHLKELVINI